MAGADPEDRAAVIAQHRPRLRAAVHELSWLLGRGYAEKAALKLVGDKHQLSARQRMVVRRCAATDAEVEGRTAHRVDALEGAHLVIDGFNQLVTVERGLAGGAVLRGRDGVIRDVASVHGTWRRSARTGPALDLLLGATRGATRATLILDAPVSNAGRLAAIVRARGVEARLEAQADARLLEAAARPGAVLASSDGPLLDRAPRWFPLAEHALANAGIEPVDLRP